MILDFLIEIIFDNSISLLYSRLADYLFLLMSILKGWVFQENLLLSNKF